jgi:hypothetical protein
MRRYGRLRGDGSSIETNERKRCEERKTYNIRLGAYS